MSIDSEQDIEALRKIGKIVSDTLRMMREACVPGIKTRELDDIATDYLALMGAQSAPKLCYDFPGSTCICINNEVAHGIPGSRRIKAGDLVNIDVSAELNGYFADTGASFVVTPGKSELQDLCDATHGALRECLKVVKAGVPINEIGRTIENYASDRGYTVIKNLCSHGVGRKLHEYPTEILPFYNAKDRRKLTDGLVITIEPFLSTGAWKVDESNDGWTLKTPKQFRSAQFEHTMIITTGDPIVLTHHI